MLCVLCCLGAQMLATEVIVGPDIPDVTDDEDNDVGMVETHEEQIEVWTHIWKIWFDFVDD